MPVNPFLIGDGNVCNVVIVPAGADLAMLKNPNDAIAQIKFSGSVKQYGVNDISCPEGGRVLQTFNFDGHLAGSFHFSNEVHDFSHLLVHGEKIDDTDKAKEYALHLFHLCKSNNVEAFAAEFVPKMKDYAKASFEQEAPFFNDFKSFVENDFFKFPDKSDLPTNHTLYTRELCHGRVIEVGLLPNHALLQRDSDEEGKSLYEIPIYVGMIDKQLKVVR